MSAPRKIVIIGPESTGKSTLSSALADALGTIWVPEYARQYLEPRSNRYDYEDMLLIAEGQLRLEAEMEQKAKRWLICDTDLYVIKVWSEHRYATVDYRILQQIAVRQYDLYLLCDTDMPWAEDPLREYPDPQMRRYFYQVYHDIVVHSGLPWVCVTGSPEQRLRQALDAIGDLEIAATLQADKTITLRPE
jgi:NadR type nicotinamide-nucleotide adenylyltransferase